MVKVATYSRVGAIGGLLIAVTSVPAVDAPTAGYDGFKLGSYVHVRPSVGVRVDNVEKNIGERKFAFNKLQVYALPKKLRPPLTTMGAGES